MTLEEYRKLSEADRMTVAVSQAAAATAGRTILSGSSAAASALARAERFSEQIEGVTGSGGFDSLSPRQKLELINAMALIDTDGTQELAAEDASRKRRASFRLRHRRVLLSEKRRAGT